MDHREFQVSRQKLGKTQKQLAGLLGTSLKAIQSFEQGWRTVPAHVERQTLFLLAMKMGSRNQDGFLKCFLYLSSGLSCLFQLNFQRKKL